jgi:hypothetical protein
VGHDGAKKTAEKGAYRRHETYTKVLGNTIP